jgi:hypothetical protein
MDRAVPEKRPEEPGVSGSAPTLPAAAVLYRFRIFGRDTRIVHR